MNPAKIRLSPKEMDLVTNADWILTKNDIILKTRLLLEELSAEQEEAVKPYRLKLPGEILSQRPKITKGENYKGLPYLVLDYPRYFEKENVVAIRTMFWWGHFFSITLHLSGQYKSRFEDRFINNYELLKKKDLYYCVNEDPWQHHFEKDNYQPVRGYPESKFSERVKSGDFLKLSYKLPLTEWNEAPVILLDNFCFLLTLLQE